MCVPLRYKKNYCDNKLFKHEMSREKKKLIMEVPLENAAMLSNRNQSYGRHYNGCELILVLVRAGLCF